MQISTLVKTLKKLNDVKPLDWDVEVTRVVEIDALQTQIEVLCVGEASTVNGTLLIANGVSTTQDLPIVVFLAKSLQAEITGVERTEADIKRDAEAGFIVPRSLEKLRKKMQKDLDTLTEKLNKRGIT